MNRYEPRRATAAESGDPNRANPCRQVDLGAVTAELATGLPALMAVVMVAVGLIWTVSLQARCGDAARIGARVAARGDDDATVVRWASLAAPPGAQVSVTRGSGVVDVKVRCPVGIDGEWPVGTVEAVAVTLAEDGVTSGGGQGIAGLDGGDLDGAGLGSDADDSEAGVTEPASGAEHGVGPAG